MDIVTHGKTLAQQICMDYGSRIRYIRSLQASVSTANKVGGGFDTFTQEDIEYINLICSQAEVRAKEKYDADREAEKGKSVRSPQANSRSQEINS